MKELKQQMDMETPDPILSIVVTKDSTPEMDILHGKLTKDFDGEMVETERGKHVLSEKIIKLIEQKQTELKSDHETGGNMAFVMKEWEQTKADKFKYEKEVQRVANYKKQTVAAFEKSEKTEIELHSVANQFEALQQKHEVMEEVYIKLRRDLTAMMDKYGKLEYEYNKCKLKLKQVREQNDEFSLDDDNDNEHHDEDAVSLHIDDTYD